MLWPAVPTAHQGQLPIPGSWPFVRLFAARVASKVPAEVAA
jgi:hypothetical protein